MEIIEAIDVKTNEKFFLVAATKDEKTLYTLDFEKEKAIEKMEKLLGDNNV